MKKWIKKEKSDAEEFSGKRTARSGGFWSFAGDVSTDTFLIDSKHTEKKSYTVTGDIWNKIFKEALRARKIPMLSIQVQDIELVILDKHDLIALLQQHPDS